MTDAPRSNTTREVLDAEDLWARDPTTGAMIGSPVEYVNELETLLAREPAGSLRTAGEFFFRMDSRTEGALTPVVLSGAALASFRTSLPGAMMAVSKRFAQRFSASAADSCSPGPTPGLAPLATDVRHVSGVLRDLVASHFPPGVGTETDFELAPLEEAFERFANGELRIWLPAAGVWATQPSSGYYFFFAELAFVALELGTDTDLWGPLANALVRTQRIFMSVYAPGVASPDQMDYHPRHFDAARMWSGAAKRTLREEYAGLSLEALSREAAANARAAFPGFRP